MSIKNYGVWVAHPKRVSAERAAEDSESPHIHLFYDDGSGGKFDGARRASINVKSLSKISEIVFWIIRDFRHPITDELEKLDKGFHPIASQAGGIALDYIRGNLMNLKEGRVLPHDLPGSENDIVDYMLPELESAIQRKTTVYLFGEPYSDEQGIHDIHMNQGSAGKFDKYNGVWQDGGIVVHFPAENRFSAIFLAFASQAVHTDEDKGDALPGSPNFKQFISGEIEEEVEVAIADDLRVMIVAALVNPEGPENQPGQEGRPEMVYLLNRSKKGISLGGWSLLNRGDEARVISDDIWLAPGEVRAVTMGTIPLSNKGGLITLLDEKGVKIDGVSYTKEQAGAEGEIIVFR